ncbi:hypothetical protein TVNIR_3466 [Thioalkalivibrio nitratireducens DSM 14787]|uniref:Uncharacterized protein n=1 Tax=Thioalkalivibrio nitratireducens (strain DSM 14787 / UNIQEM 213 / ALEN2) TaxID=1255043 RepID=L0E1I1_THIND|nr:hypothetical protein TVNIR_3466 [Thioalkalivibrio nitratireducens DSM 14787]
MGIGRPSWVSALVVELLGLAVFGAAAMPSCIGARLWLSNTLFPA